VRELGDLSDGRHGADGVGGPWKCDDPRSLGEQRTQVAEVEAAFTVDVAEAHGQIPVARELEPRGDVAVVVELRAHDLVARLPFA